jgi:hypothetical protein
VVLTQYNLKQHTGSGATVTWATTDKGWKIIYADGVASNPNVAEVGFGGLTRWFNYTSSI